MSFQSKFNIQFEDFNISLAKIFRNLRTDTEFCDITFECADSGSQQLHGHKAILASFSPVLRDMLKQNKGNDHMLLKGASFYDLQAIFDFIYYGEVNIKRSRLSSFMAVAEDLKIEALSDCKIEDDDEENITEDNPTAMQGSDTLGNDLTLNKDESQGQPVENFLVNKDASIGAIELYLEPSGVIKDNHRDFLRERLTHLMHSRNIALQSLSDEKDKTFPDNLVVKTEESECEQPITKAGINDETQTNSDDRVSNRKPTNIQIKTFVCEKCNYTSSKKPDLVKHIRTVHNKARYYSCDQCNYKASSKSIIVQHVKSVHMKIKEFKCNTCSYTCSMTQHLTKHNKLVHSKIKDFRCTECNYTCSFKHSLKRHEKQVHTKIKDIQCPQCSYTCSQKQNLNIHIKQVHTKLKDFECSQCSYASSLKHQLKRHFKRKHTNLKEFECSQCSYASSLKEQLKRHFKRKHTNLKEFQFNQ